MRDFTLKQYLFLLKSLLKQGFLFDTYSRCTELSDKMFVILRHDVDRLPDNSLIFARIENELGINGTYYFRIVPQSFDVQIIKEIASLGHEIGYHYETMDTARGNVDKAYDEFCSNLENFRKIVPVETICMHGSPLSKFDNRALWKKYDYRKLGIKAEPYFDLDFSRVLYLTDTGRRWDGGKYSVRDKVVSRQSAVSSQQSPVKIHKPETGNLKLTFHSTSDIMEAANSGLLPDQIMMTFHPQRWTDKPLPWLKELVLQNIKNVVKRLVVSFKG
jgi:hypothetical protein